ncbi:CocE/NonD family hydrolase [Chryseobacterium aquaticum]|uniref:CocE/NonD family hydrolase n=1 Tax=Chryseobacterium aquaticum TaxID=452084 RepID=A0A848N4H2_9FLAO|nr:MULTISPECIES: CocE/NonD family hydrolase [Chryseobacterium]NMR33570.1 CocE/NonD family hydrolase [Chryseobacterium aquaticum]NRQ45644.1 CocE/NonD family hydrolase [Chryseobacterium sp. C-204]
MNKYFIFAAILISNLLFAQKISIKQFEKSTFDDIKPLINYLSQEVLSKYNNEKNKKTYYDNVLRINMLIGNYNLAQKQLDTLRGLYQKDSPIAAVTMGTQHEVFMNTLKNGDSKTNFEKAYLVELEKKYNTLPVKSRIILPKYFEGDENKIKESIISILNKDVVGKDSIDLKTAISLARNYNGYVLVKESFHIAQQYLKRKDEESYIIYDNIKVTTRNNAELTLNIAIDKKTPKPQSTILINTIYSSKSKINDAKEYASEGYACVILNTRGKYLSNDTIEPFEHEADDINEVIDWIVKQPWSDGKIGMIGGSYLGFSQWAATKKLHPALKTIIPQASVGIGTMDYPMSNHVFTSYALRWIHYTTNNKFTDDTSFRNEKEWDSVYRKWYQSGLGFNKLDSISGKKSEIFQKWLRHPSYDSFWSSMVPYKKEFSKINIPILTTTGYYDSDQLGAFYYFREHHKYNKNANHYMIVGPYDHYGAQGDINTNYKGYKIDEVAKIDLDKICIEWFDYILKEKPKPIFIKGKINYQVMGANQWKSTNNLDKFEKTKLKFYLNTDSSLSSALDKKGFKTLQVDFKDRTDADSLLAFEYNVIDKVLPKDNSIVYTTKVIDKPMEFTGNFTGKIYFQTNKKDVDLKGFLYEQLPNGKYFLLSTYLGRASYNENPERRTLLKPEKREFINITNNEFVSKIIEKGSKLVFVLGVNKTPRYQINYGTGKDVSDETIADAKEPLEIKWYNDSYIEIPIMQE